MKKSVDAGKPFFLYFNHSLMHLPMITRAEFKGGSPEQGEWADCLLELDADFGTILDTLKELGVDDNKIVVFAGDNGPEDKLEPWRGHPQASSTVPTSREWKGRCAPHAWCAIPDKVAAGQQSNDIVHITDMYTTLLRWAGTDIPRDREIDGVDQGAPFLEAKQTGSDDGKAFHTGWAIRSTAQSGRTSKRFSSSSASSSTRHRHTPTPASSTCSPTPKNVNPSNTPTCTPGSWPTSPDSSGSSRQVCEREPPIPFGAPLDYVPTAPQGN